jgi:hypothetical protein
LDICRLFDHSITIDHINRLFDTGVHCIILVPDNGWREQPDLFCRPDVQPGESGTWVDRRFGRRLRFILKLLQELAGSKSLDCEKGYRDQTYSRKSHVDDGDANGDDSKWERLTHEEEYYMW